MLKVVVDTNVLVSALIQKSFPYRIVFDLFIEGKITVCVSEQLLQEYYEVLSRPKFSRFPEFYERVQMLMVDIEEKTEIYHPTASIDLISDPDDNMILELAEECKAEFIITGNSNDFSLSQYKNTRIVSPREFWEIWQSTA